MLLSWFESRIDAFPEEDPAPLPRTLIPFLWECARGVRGWLVALALVTSAIAAYEALLFSMLGHVVDWLGKVEPSALWRERRGTLALLASILLVSPLLIAAGSLIKHQALAASYPMRMRWRFHRLMLAQSMTFFQDDFAGRIATKVMQTALAVRETWFIVAEMLVYVTIYFATLVAVVGGFDRHLMLPFLCWMVGYGAACRYFVPRLARTATEQADARSLMAGRITDAYTNIATVKLFSHARREAAFAREAMREFMATVARQMRLVTGFEVANHVLSVLLIGATAGVALQLWVQGAVGVGAVAAATAMALRLNGISHWVMWEMAALFEHVGTVQDGLNTLARPVAVTDAPQALPLVVSRGEVRFENVQFSYGGKRPVFEGLSLTIRPGEKIGLVGRSGAGKSTLVNLLLRFYDLEGGRILIDGQDIASATQESVRAQIGMVTQDTSLLHRSVRDNIVYGRPDATESDMLAAAERARAADFVGGLADAKGRAGYAAHVGERGVKLSGGQRQRIAIARVLVKDAPILLLDEATSALDSEVEAAIQETLDTLMQGKTVVAIAHRLSTIAAMDRLIVLDQGRIVEEGDHASLLARQGVYAGLWARQSGGFLGEDVSPHATREGAAVADASEVALEAALDAAVDSQSALTDWPVPPAKDLSPV